MSTHRTASAVLTPAILLCLTACGSDSSPEATTDPTTEATTEATDTPELTFTVSGTYAEQGGYDPGSDECVSGEDEITIKSSTTRDIVYGGKTSADGKFDKQAKACLYKFHIPKVPMKGNVYAMVIGTSEPLDFVVSDAEGLFITGTAP